MTGYTQTLYALPPRGRRMLDVTLPARFLLPSLGAVVFAVTLCQVLFLSQGAQALFRDSDTGWHVRNGEAILQNFALPRVDHFSYTREGQQWFAWEWLSDAAFGGAYRVAGLAGVALLAALAIALTAWGVARLSLSLGGNLFFTAAAVVVLLGTTGIHWLARPHVFSWLLALMFLSIAEHARRGRTRWLYALPVVACVWANVHGSFLLGPAMLFTYVIGEWFTNFAVNVSTNELGTPSRIPLLGKGGVAAPSIKMFRRHLIWRGRGGSFKQPKNFSTNTTPSAPSEVASQHLLDGASTPPQLRRGLASAELVPQPRLVTQPIALTALLSLLATFINPYGWRLHEHVFTYLQTDYLMDHISEFRSFSFHSPGAYYVELFFFIAVLGVIALLRQRAFGPALLAMAMLHISLYSARHIPTAAVLLIPLAVAALTREAREFHRLHTFLDYSDRIRAIDRRVLGVVPIAVVLIGTIAGVTMLARAGSIEFNPNVFPVEAANFLERNNLNARVFSKDQWGGYLIFRFQGRTKVFIDGRSDFYGQQLLEAYAEIADVKPAWNVVLKQYNVGLVLIPPEHALASALQLSADWKRIYSDHVAAIFERVG